MKRITALVLLIFSFSCSIDGLRDIDSSGELEGQWILEEVSCFCYFENYDFSQNQLWIFPEQRFLVSRSNTQEPLGISGPNVPTSITLEDDLITEGTSGRSYRYTLENDRLILQYVDVEEIADDEISYYFKKGSAKSDCLDPDRIQNDVACTKIYAPVCGCDGYTYSNTCEAEINGITSYSEGACN
jgi:hypothetical protein